MSSKTQHRYNAQHPHHEPHKPTQLHPTSPALDIEGRQRDLRLIRRGHRTVARAIPAILGEALLTHVRDGGAGAVQTSAQKGAADAGGPHGVEGAVGHGGDVVAVLDDGVALGVVVGRVEGRDVGVVDVRGVGEIDDQWGGGGHVGRVAAEEGGAGVEAEVDEGVLVRDVGEGGAVLDAGGVDAALVGGDQAGAVGPVVGGVGGGVDGEDDVDGAVGLDERVEGDVL